MTADRSDEQNAPAERVAELCADVKGRLEAGKERLYQEIRSYPTPITGCDQQFNYLLERQSAAVRECAQIDALLAAADGKPKVRTRLQDLVRDSRTLDDAEKQRLLSRLPGEAQQVKSGS